MRHRRDRLPARARRRGFRPAALGELGAEVHDHDAVDQVHDEVHVVLDQHDGHAFAAQGAQQIGQGSFLQSAQSRGGLVQDDDDRIGRERARDFQQALLAEREVAGKLAEFVGKPDALELADRLGAGGALLGAIEPKGAGEDIRCGSGDKFRAGIPSSSVMVGRKWTCWKVRAMPRAAMRRASDA